GGSATSAVLLGWRLCWRQFSILRYEHRIERTEHEVERLFVVLLRHLRLPLRDLRQNAGKLATLLRSRQAVGATISAAESDSALDDSVNSSIENQGLRLAEQINASAADLDRIAAGLVRLGKIRKVQPEMEWLEMEPVVLRVVKELESAIDLADAVVEMGDLPDAVGDPTLVEQVWRELIANALQNLSPHRRGKVRIWGWEEGGRPLYCVQDNGIGIAEVEVEKIFEMYYRVDPASKRQGLGLALVRRIVEKHSGRLWVSSTPGKGSQFTFSLAKP
ncbi:MAG: HAMP domain-containing histidine kinase, partial [Phycisphaerae bacterium]|nr:HAMP domain-containing histidine kinase [Phycisphaerae bacterium]